MDEPISQASKFYSETRESCSHIHPLPDLQLESAKQANNASELNAKIISAKIDSINTSSEKVSQADFARIKGTWKGLGYLVSTCKNIVKTIEGLIQYREGGGQSLVGFQLILSNDRKIPFQKANLADVRTPDLPQIVTCDENAIYIVKRPNKNSLMINRFTHSGELIDALRITLPNIEDKKIWDELWEITPMNNQLSIVLANYTYTQTANLGGMINQKQIYTAELPR